MKKLFLIALMALLTASFSYAEQSAQTYSGNDLIKGAEQSVFINAYNNSGGAIGSGSVVIIDTAATVASSSVGSYFTSSTTAQDARVLGITAQDIPATRVGRICVRGVCKANLLAPTVALNGTTLLYPAGSSLAVSATSLKSSTPSTAYSYGQYGIVLRGSESNGELANNIYYVWIGGVSQK